MATMNEFLDKALTDIKIDEVSAAYAADIKFNIKLTGVKNMNDAQKRAQRFVDDVTKKFSLFDPSGEVDGVEGPM